MEGWIKLHRSVSNNWIWSIKPFSPGQAWIDLLMLANHNGKSKLFVRGIEIEINRGVVGWSEVKLSQRWGWSRSKLRKFLSRLEKEQQIKQQKNNISLLISIINYDTYQTTEQQKEQQKNSRKTAKEQQKDTNKNDKKEKNYKNILLSELKNSDFDDPTFFEITISFYELFKNNLTEKGISTEKLKKSKGGWVDSIRMLIEIDKYTIDDIRDVFRLLQNDDFWKTNILSTSKLREKFDKLLLKARTNGQNKSNSKGGATINELAEITAKHFGTVNIQR